MRRLVALSAAALLALAAPALALPEDEPVFVEQAVWFHDGGAKVGNLAAVDEGANPLVFDTRRPDTSVTGGAGGGQLADAASEIVLGDYNSASGPVFRGTFTGDLDTLDVDLYAASPRATRGGALSVRTQLVVDGATLYAADTATDVQTVPGGNAAVLGKWRYDGIHDLMKALRMDVGPDVEHEVELRVLVFFLASETVFLYDTTEVPSGMVFNDDAPLAGRTVLPVA